MELYLIRHAETQANVAKQFSGWTDSPITPQGYMQMKRLAAIMSDKGMDRVYTSPSRRTIETARSFCQKSIPMEELAEINFGKMEGMNFQEMERKYPEEIKKMVHQGDDYIYPQGEGIHSFCQRIKKGLDNILDAGENHEKIAVVGHGGSIRCLISLLLTGDHQLFWHLKIDNASISKFVVNERFAVMEYMNRHK